MIKSASEKAKSDTTLERLFEDVSQYATVYLLSKQRQKGCDGMGELATIKEEFRDVVDKMIQYCKGKEYIAEGVSYDIDSIADEISKM